MDRMYFSFVTNLPDSVDDKLTVKVEHICFKTPDGIFVSISCFGEAEYGVKDGVYCCRFKGLEYHAQKEGSDEVLLKKGEKPDDALLRMLSEGFIAQVCFDYTHDEELYNLPAEGLPSCKDISCEIEQTSPTNDSNVYHMTFREEVPAIEFLF